MSEKTNNFEEDYRKLQEIVEWFESDSVDIDKAMAKFEEGMKLAEKLQKKVKTAESKIEELQLKFK